MALQPHERLEIQLAEWVGVDPAGMVACSSGTAALHLACEALEMPLGSRVLVPDYTMIACARAVSAAGLEPVFVDCNPLDLNMDPVAGDRAGSDVKGVMAVMFVHVYGRQCDMDWADGASKSSPRCFVIEDMAECHGATPSQETDAAAWSFYRNKLVHGEEGGAVWFRDRARADLARELRSVGMGKVHDYQHRPRGMNYRIADCCAQLVSESLLNVWGETRARRQCEAIYEQFCPAEWRMPARTSPWVYDVRIPGLTRAVQAEVVQSLNATGLAARMGFYPLHLQREYLNCACYRRTDCDSAYSASVAAADEVFYLPLQWSRWGEQLDPVRAQGIFDTIRAVVARRSPPA